jgi:ribulose-phosphate 3-epimerase
MQIRILPSLLAADMGNLAAEAKKAEQCGGDALHLDIMDGVFVPNISMGPAVAQMADRNVDIPLNVHLMLLYPDRFAERFIDAGADAVLIHVEADCDVPGTLETIRQRGVKAGITLNPETPAESVFPVLDKVDQVLCMSVHPGYGGQAFIPETLPKIQAIREQARTLGLANLDILVDGGIDLQTAPACAAHGATSLIAGTALYRASDMQADITRMRNDSQRAADTHMV